MKAAILFFAAGMAAVLSAWITRQAAPDITAANLGGQVKIDSNPPAEFWEVWKTRTP